MSEDPFSGPQWYGVDQNFYGEYCYDCLYCGNVFGYAPGTGPITGWGNMGLSYGLNVQCPRCGSTNTSGPRLKKQEEKVARYPATMPEGFIPGLEYFTGQVPDELWVDAYIEASRRRNSENR